LASLFEPVDEPNRLYYGDNLDVLRRDVDDGSIDVVYLDPPFNSNRAYNVIFAQHDTYDESAQIEAFDDTWHWTPETDATFTRLLSGGIPAKAADALAAMRTLLGENDAMAYLVNMTPRLVDLHRVLKPTGCLYLHCDPTMSHYLKVLLDSIFDPRNMRNEIVWKRTTAHSDTRQGLVQYGRIHDVLLFYSKSTKWTWNPIYTEYDDAYVASKYRYEEAETERRYRKDNMTAAKPGGDTSFEWRVKRRAGVREWVADLDDEWQTPQPGTEYRGVAPYKNRFWAYSRDNMREMAEAGRLIHTRTGMPEYKRYLDEMEGVSLQDLWTDIDPINSQAQERLGYPTQKPEALLDRVVRTSSNEGDVVLDPFCGCGTTVAVAQRLNRRWVGIDITYIAVDLIEKRLQHTFGETIKDTYEVHGMPRDVAGAQALFRQDELDFERWAVSLVNGTPNEKHVGDRGADGVIRFVTDASGGTGRAIVSVKGGKQIGPHFVRDLLGTVETQKAEMGVLVTLTKPTRGMIDAADHAGTYLWPVNSQRFPKIQLVTISELLAGKRLQSPPTLTPYIKARRMHVPAEQLPFDLLQEAKAKPSKRKPGAVRR